MNIDGTITVSDDGRGIPVDIHKGEKICCRSDYDATACGGKFDHDSISFWRSSWSRRLSSKCIVSKLKIRNLQRKKFYIEFKDGKAKAH